MTTFDERERAFEAAFAHDQEMHFLAIAHRNHAVGLWAAEKLGKTGAEAENYAKDLVAAGVKKAGDGVISGKVAEDFKAAGITLAPLELDQKMLEFLNEAVIAQKAKPSS